MRCAEEKTCAAFPDAGEECWAIAGTMRDSEMEKKLEKMSIMARDPGRDLTEPQLMQMQNRKTTKLCKFIERYGSCKCCPYFKYIKEFDRQERIRKKDVKW